MAIKFDDYIKKLPKKERDAIAKRSAELIAGRIDFARIAQSASLFANNSGEEIAR